MFFWDFFLRKNVFLSEHQKAAAVLWKRVVLVKIFQRAEFILFLCFPWSAFPTYGMHWQLVSCPNGA
jgi:hypothetical protein